MAADDCTGRGHEMDAAGALAEAIMRQVPRAQAALAELAAWWAVARDCARYLTRRFRPMRPGRAA